LTLRFLGLTFVSVMSSAEETPNPSLRPSIFLSYASEDRTAASSIRDAMAALGLEVWYDENELGGGDAWDKKIRRQIRECDYFMALISAQTEARHEGYFRREWRLAVERALDMADDHTFLLPVVIDGTDQASARVPEKFLDVQWLKVPGGVPTPALTALCNRLISGGSLAPPAPRRPVTRVKGDRSAPPPQAMPAFPIEDPGQRVKFWVHVAGWAIKSAWIGFKRLPRWIRLLVYIWLSLFLMSRGCARNRTTPAALPPATAEKLKAIAENYQGSSKKDDIAKLGVEIAREFAKATDGDSPAAKPLLAVPFTAPTGNAADAKLADSTFALLYGQISISHQDQVGLSKEPLASVDVTVAVADGQKNHSDYVLFGGIENAGESRVLTVEIVKVSTGSVLWNKSYPAATADPSAIALEAGAKIPSLDD
jgi:TolB-like protein